MMKGRLFEDLGKKERVKDLFVSIVVLIGNLEFESEAIEKSS